MSGVRVANPELKALGLTMPGFVRRGKVIASLPSLGLLTVAGLTPSEHEVAYFEIDEGEPPDLSGFDVVAISSLTARVEEAYALADGVRETGVKVVMGGLHVSVRDFVKESGLAEVQCTVMTPLFRS